MKNEIGSSAKAVRTRGFDGFDSTRGRATRGSTNTLANSTPSRGLSQYEYGKVLKFSFFFQLGLRLRTASLVGTMRKHTTGLTIILGEM